MGELVALVWNLGKLLLKLAMLALERGVLAPEGLVSGF